MEELNKRDMETLFSAIIKAYLKDKIDLQIYAKGVNVVIKDDAAGLKECFVTFPEHEDRDPRYPEE
ncbi:MAG: hypothetical protein M1361_01480 [Patescibacteria group bacterium]|nr:hypothetical protein [Patescibacteria group bacterium]MCL5224268.1 hypothetical protein [Patescibacteria group bacterium]